MTDHFWSKLWKWLTKNILSYITEPESSFIISKFHILWTSSFIYVEITTFKILFEYLKRLFSINITIGLVSAAQPEPVETLWFWLYRCCLVPLPRITSLNRPISNFFYINKNHFTNINMMMRIIFWCVQYLHFVFCSCLSEETQNPGTESLNWTLSFLSLL